MDDASPHHQVHVSPHPRRARTAAGALWCHQSDAAEAVLVRSHHVVCINLLRPAVIQHELWPIPSHLHLALPEAVSSTLPTRQGTLPGRAQKQQPDTGF